MTELEKLLAQLEPMALPLPLPGLLVVVAAPDLEVDLGQFKAVSNTQSYRGLKARIRAQALTLTRQVQPLPARRVSPADGIPKLWTAFGAATMSLQERLEALRRALPEDPGCPTV